MILHSWIQPDTSHVEASSPIVFLHGLFGNWENWRSPQKALAQHHTTIGLDLRNHGLSPHDDAMDYASMANDVAETLHDLGVTTCHVLGHSMGGKVALALTNLTSVQIQSLTIVDISARRYQGQHYEILDAMSQIQPASLPNRKAADQQMAERVPDLMTRQFLLKNLIGHRDGGKTGYRWALNLPVLTQHYDNLLDVPPMADHFDRPLLVIRGSLSDYVTDEDAFRYQRWANHVQIETIAGAGHWPHASHGPQVLELLENFYSR